MATDVNGRESAEQTPERPGAPTDPQTRSGGLPETHHEARPLDAPDDFVFTTLIANHPDPATASRALALAEANALRRAALDMDTHCEQYGVFGVGDRLHRLANNTETGWNRPPATEPVPDFFQPGRTYTYAYWQFRCDVVTTHPGTGRRTALGWFRASGGEWRSFNSTEDEWAEDAWKATVTVSGEASS